MLRFDRLPLSIWFVIGAVGCQIGFAIALAEGVYFSLGVLVVVGLLLVLLRIAIARWLLVLLILAQMYAVWALQDSGGFAAADLIVLLLSAGQIGALLMPETRNYVSAKGLAR
jgi:hypothetical protein